MSYDLLQILAANRLGEDRPEPPNPEISEVNILDYGKYVGWNNWIYALGLGGEHKVANINDVNSAIEEEIQRCKQLNFGAQRECCCIKKINFYGHGGPGFMSIGAGKGAKYVWSLPLGINIPANLFDVPLPGSVRKTPPDEAGEDQVVNVSNMHKLTVTIKSSMCKGGEVFFHGCSVAEGVMGEDFLRKVANDWDVDATGFTGGTTPFNHLGKTVTKQPEWYVFWRRMLERIKERRNCQKCEGAR